MLRGLLFLCFLPGLIATEDDGVAEDDLHLHFFCGVIDASNIYRSRLVRVDPRPHMIINDRGMEKVQLDVFKKCGRTLTLDMGNNRLNVLSGRMLNGLRNLTELNVFNNTIQNVIDGTFNEMPHLRELTLSYNRLAGLGAEVRSGLRELRKLHFSNNPIILGEDGFTGLSQLELLELTGANISTIPSGSFNGLDHLERLDLSSNKLTDISASTFQGLIGLLELDLSMNMISTISKDSFKGLDNLTSLWLNNNEIGSLRTDGIFQGIPQLHFMFMHANPLKIMDVAVFKDMQSVYILPGFVINSGETISFNFTNAISAVYDCRRRGIEVESHNSNSETVGVFSYDYFLPYICVSSTTADLPNPKPNVTHTDKPTVTVIS